MAKGYGGQSCADAIRKFMNNNNEPLSYSEIFEGIKGEGTWKDTTIWRMLMSNVVNLIPARFEWKNTDPFLFLRSDGRYELYDEKKHPQPIK